MTLELVVDKLDSIPEAIRSEYTEKDGKFHLNVNGIEDTAGLKSALQKERTAAANANKALSAFTALGKTPEEIAAQVAAETSAKEEALKKAGKHDEVLKQHLDKAAKERAVEVDGLKLERDAAIASEKAAIVETKVTGALVKSKATPEGIDLLADRLGKRIDVQRVDGQRKIVIMQADGKTPMIGKGPDGLATFDDLVAEAVKQYPSLFEATGAGGSGKQPNDRGAGGAGAKTLTRKAYDELSSGDRAAKMKEGYRVVD